jgi:hypothetical protein
MVVQPATTSPAFARRSMRPSPRSPALRNDGKLNRPTETQHQAETRPRPRAEIGFVLPFRVDPSRCFVGRLLPPLRSLDFLASFCQLGSPLGGRRGRHMTALQSIGFVLPKRRTARLSTVYRSIKMLVAVCGLERLGARSGFGRRTRGGSPAPERAGEGFRLSWFLRGLLKTGRYRESTGNRRWAFEKEFRVAAKPIARL